VADNVYNTFLDYLANLLREERLIVIEQSLVDRIFDLLSNMIMSPPVECALECRLSL